MKQVIRVSRVDGGAYFHLDPSGIVDYEPTAYDADWSLITMSRGTATALPSTEEKAAAA